jgi:hypothetical protein
MIEALRNALQKCDDIEAMARVLHSQAATTIKGKVHSESNGNGNGLDRMRLPDPHRKKHSKHSDKDQIREAALIAIDKAGENGIDSVSLASLLIANGVLPSTMTRQSAVTAVRMALVPLVEAKRIASALARTGKMSRRVYYTTGDSSVIHQPTKKNDETVRDSAGHNGRTDRLRNFLVTTLAKQTSPMPVAEMQRMAIEEAGFDFKWGKGDTLRNQVGRLLRVMLRAGRVKRFGKGKHGGGGEAFTYVIVRPKISVSKTL